MAIKGLSLLYIALFLYAIRQRRYKASKLADLKNVKERYFFARKYWS